MLRQNHLRKRLIEENLQNYFKLLLKYCTCALEVCYNKGRFFCVQKLRSRRGRNEHGAIVYFSVRVSQTQGDVVEENAYRKVKAVADLHPGRIVLGSDTIVYQNGKVLGKPRDEEEAKQMLSALSDSWHTVYTGV